MEARPPSGLEGTGPAVEAGRGGGEWFENWQRKDITKKGEPTGIDRVDSEVDGNKRGDTGQGTIQKKRDHRARLQGPTGTWGAGQGRQDSE